MITKKTNVPRPWCLALSDRNSGSCIRWAPDKISSPLMNMSYELEYFYHTRHITVSSYNAGPVVAAAETGFKNLDFKVFLTKK